MERGGHYGTTLLLGGICIVWFGVGWGVLATAIMLLFTLLPDQDQYIPESIVRHRGPTHSLTFTVVVAFVTASTVAYPIHLGQWVAVEYGPLASPVLSSGSVWAFVGGVVAAALVGHLATDALTKGGGYRIEPLWPFSSWTVALGLCCSDNVAWNAALLASGLTAFAAAIVHELHYSILPSIPGV